MKEDSMNAIQLLKHDHEKARQMFGQIQAAPAAERGRLWKTLEPELKLHEQIEESALYGPVARELGSSDEALADWQEHHQEEVGELEDLIQEIDELDPSGEDWLAKVQEAQQALEHHIREEEDDAWPRIQQAWDASKLEQAGQLMETLKREKMPRAA
jgi:hypothetical protein